MNPLLTTLVKKRLVYPTFSGNKGDSKALARQLDVALMDNGFKLSRDLLRELGSHSFESALISAQTILSAVKELVGAHVKHNTYFIDFPKNVPNTLEFWGKLLAEFYEETGEYTDNLLDFPTYGNYQHTYDAMLERHDKWRGKVKLKVIHLGGDVVDEMHSLYSDLAGSKVPLNEDDRKLIADLFRHGYSTDVKPAIRENKAIINALVLETGNPIEVDTPVDVLRLAAYLSGGDVTLAEQTKFKKLSRPIRRALLSGLDEVMADDSKLDDVNRYVERFKRLGSVLHPHEYAKAYPGALKVFDFAGGKLKHQTWGSQVNKALDKGRLVDAATLLGQKPGYFVRSLDKLVREVTTEKQFAVIADILKESINRVSGRVLLSLVEHLDNRLNQSESRIFVNRAGKGYVTPNTLAPLKPARIKTLSTILWNELAKRVPAKDALVINDDVATVAVPLSDKTKSEGFRVLPRGSVLSLDASKDVLRFFVYWHQTSERTDYDLSAAFFDKDFNLLEQISWTNVGLGNRSKTGEFKTSFAGSACHSGDIIDAPNGATEFIDISLKSLDPRVTYILPTINAYTGEAFAQCREAFMGYMLREAVNKGAPFEAKSVQTKFALRGDKNGVGVPMVFMRTDEGWKAKWLDLYSKGMPWGNRVEQNRFSTALLAKTIIGRDYLTMGRLLDLYRAKARRVHKVDSKHLPKQVTYIGIDRPDHIKGEIYGLDNLKSLIPA